MIITFCLSQNIQGVYFCWGQGYILDCYTGPIKMHSLTLELQGHDSMIYSPQYASIQGFWKFTSNQTNRQTNVHPGLFFVQVH